MKLPVIEKVELVRKEIEVSQYNILIEELADIIYGEFVRFHHDLPNNDSVPSINERTAS